MVIAQNVGVYNRPCKGERVSGDGYLIKALDSGLFIALFDVLGHGPDAYQTSLEYQRYLNENAQANLITLLIAFNEHAKGSRGAVLSLAYMPHNSSKLHYVGMGNTVLRKLGKTNVSLLSQFGTLGKQMHTPQLQTLSLEVNDLLLFYTDGIKSAFTVENYPQIFSEDVNTIAFQIVQRYGKSHDDACCLVLRVEPC